MKPSKPKIGQGSLMAFFRQGLKELTHFLKAFPDSGPLIEEPGQIGNAPPQAVSQQTGHSQPVRVESPLNMETSMSDSPEQQVDMNSPAAEVVQETTAPQQVEFTAADSFLEQTMQEIYHMPEMQEPEQEMSQ